VKITRRQLRQIIKEQLTTPSSSGKDVSSMGRPNFENAVVNALGHAKEYRKHDAQEKINQDQTEDQKGNRVLLFTINSLDMQATSPRPINVTWTTEWSRLDPTSGKIIDAQENWKSLENWLEEYLSRRGVGLTDDDIGSYYYTYHLKD